MIGESIFTIPIYRCSPKKFQEEIELEKKRLHAYFTKGLPTDIRANYDASDLVEITMQTKWKCWQYNEIVGFIEIFILGDQIRGTKYYIKHKRIGKGIKNKNFEYMGKEFEMSTAFINSNEEIFNRLIKLLNGLTSQSTRLKNRFIDLSEIKRIGRYINWKKLIKESE
ncbi:MAG: hypothetical protein KBD15_01050 [Candidatus Magasanikbacteria bacterium]|nr:hypothetical protein [Candidatus Magasanikbacteria bacterium]